MAINEFHAIHKTILIDYLKDRQANPNSWEQMKEILKDNFGEKENSNSLMDELKMCRLSDTIEIYYMKNFGTNK